MSETDPFKRPDIPILLLIGLIAVLAVRSLQRSASPVPARANETRKVFTSTAAPRSRITPENGNQASDLPRPAER